MSIKLIGPPCTICGDPATMSINPNVSAAAGSGVYPQADSTPWEARCNKHNPYMSACPCGHYQWGGNYCQTCGAPRHASLGVQE